MSLKPTMGIAVLILAVSQSAAAVVFPHLEIPDGVVADRPTVSDFGEIVHRPIETIEAFDQRDPPIDPMIELPGPDAGYEELLEVYARALNSHDHEAATTLAERMVLLTLEQDGEHSAEHAWALSDLGAAFQHAGKHELALEPLRRSITLHKSVQGVMHEDLIGVYAYLGMAYQGLENHDRALDEFSRAQALTHRHDGTMNLSQMKILEAKAVSFEEKGDLWEAEQLYRAKLRIARNNYPADSHEAMTELLGLAGWMRNSGQIKPALTLYREALKLLAGEDGEDTPRMVTAMRGMALTHLLEFTFEVDRGLRLHRRIVALTERYPRQFSLYERIRAHLDLGDWLTLFQREEEAWDQYAKAWNLTLLDDFGDFNWSAYFAQPQLIFAGPPLSVDFLGYNKVGKDQWTDFEFNVATDGRPTHVKVIDSNMHKLTRLTAIEMWRKARFRPAMMQGAPIRTEGYQFHRIYPTRPPPDYGVVGIGGEVVSAPAPAKPDTD